MGRLLIFLTVTVASWIVIAVPTRMIAGDLQAIYAGIAFLVCAIPALGTLGWTLVVAKQPPQQQFMAAFAGTGIRLIAVSALALFLFNRVPFFRQEAGFGLWLLLAYLYTLALEIVIALRGRPITGTPGELIR